MPDEKEHEPVKPEVLNPEEKSRLFAAMDTLEEVDNDLKKFESRTQKFYAPTKAEPESQLLSIIQTAMEKNYSPELIEKMMNLQDRYEKNEALKLFNKDFAKFKQEEVRVLTDKINELFKDETGHGRGYSSVGNFLATVNPHLGKHNLAGHFDIEDIEDYKKIKVTCVISHAEGHEKRVSMAAAPDTTGPKGGIAKTEMHGRMSTLTYLMRATFSAATGIAAIDNRLDDDGNLGSGATSSNISEDQIKEINKLIIDSKINVPVFLKSLKVDDIKNLPAGKYNDAISTLKSKIKKMPKAAPQPMREPGEEG